MFVNYRTQGLILKKESLREADQCFTLYSRDFGKLEIIGRAIRKISSKLKSGAETFYLSEIEFIQGKNQKTLTDTLLLEKFRNIRKNLDRLKIAYKISESLDNLIKEQEPDMDVWQLLLEVFQRLNNLPLKTEKEKIEIVYYYFLWNLLKILGYEPELYKCILCQKKLKPGDLYFSKTEVGIACAFCAQKVKEGNKVDADIIKILRILLARNWLILSKLKIKDIYLKGLEALSKNYLAYIFAQE